MILDFSSYSNLMASSSSYSTWRYNVFTSFHEKNVRRTFLNHLRKQFSYMGIMIFDHHDIERSRTITPALRQVIRESRISIVLFSENYASSSRCLDELVEILKGKEAMGQIVIPVFYGADPSHVLKQVRKMGNAFNRTDKERLKWSQALTDVGFIPVVDFQNCDNESDMTKKIARDVSDKLNATISRDFEDVVGIEAHLETVQSLLHLGYEDEAMIVRICGPSGIGKTTIARALHSRLTCRFQLTCFMENIKGSSNSGLDEYGLKLFLQEQLLSKIFNLNGMETYHLGAMHEKLCEVEALANETTWFGRGSRIIVTTENKELLRQHGINNTYHVDFPSSEEALETLCRYAFKQSYPHKGFKELAERVVDVCDNLPLSLRMVGSSLRGRKEEEWEEVIRRLEPIIDHRDIKQVLRVVFEPSSSNKRIGKGKHRCSTCLAFLVVINLLIEIASAVADQLSSIRKPYFARISFVMSILSVVFSILDLTYKIKAHKARFRCKWPIPWFYLPSRGYRRIFGSFTDTVLLFCVVGGLVVSTINYSSIEKRVDGPIKVSIWPLFFAIGMVVSKFMEKPDNSLLQKMY